MRDPVTLSALFAQEDRPAPRGATAAVPLAAAAAGGSPAGGAREGAATLRARRTKRPRRRIPASDQEFLVHLQSWGLGVVL